MKPVYRAFFAIFVLCGLFGVFGTVRAESIESFDVRVTVQENATIEVTEQIVYDFGDKELHGIFRKIPYSYQAKTETYTAEIRSVLVTDENGEPQPFNESRGNGELTIKIGDPNVTVTGAHVYVISYIVEGPFLYFDEFDEFYWNVTGFWDQPIRKAGVLVDLPRGAQVVSAACYKGKDGSREACDSDEQLLNEERAGYSAVAKNLAPKEGLTVAVAFPKGAIVEIQKPWEEEKVNWFGLLWPFFIPLVVFVLMFRLWFVRGRDPKGRTSIVTQFSAPEGMSPSVASVVMSEKVGGSAITAEIVRLAVDGYLKIHRFEEKKLIFSVTDYLLERVGDKIPEDPVSALVLEDLWGTESFIGTAEIQGEEKEGVILSRMKHEFVDEKNRINNVVYDDVVSKGYFKENPNKVRAMYIGVGVAALFLIFWMSGMLGVLFKNDFFAPALMLSGVFVFIFGLIMPARTQEGVRMREYLLGFKRYLEVAEKDRIDFHASPEQNSAEPEKTMKLFDACLPYAMVFGVEEKWAKKFKDIYIEEPCWYSGGPGHTFSAAVFASDLSHFAADMSSATAPKSSGSGGGGSSGGGFGGGGGGSW